MPDLHVVLLALLQGVTEFLPISSSAHLILLPRVAGWPDQGLHFDMATHAGSLLAVIWFFRKDLRTMIAAIPRALRHRELASDSDSFLPAALLVGTLPVAVAGLALQDFVATGGRSPTVIAGTSIFFGLLLGIADWRGRRERGLARITWRDVLVIGLFQAVALIPGTSRSGITITAALGLGLTRPGAARFSFLLAIPVGLLVALKDLSDLFGGAAGPVDWSAIALGFTVAMVSAYAVIVWLLGWLERRSLQLFVWYRVALGVFLLVWF